MNREYLLNLACLLHNSFENGVHAKKKLCELECEPDDGVRAKMKRVMQCGSPARLLQHSHSENGRNWAASPVPSLRAKGRKDKSAKAKKKKMESMGKERLGRCSR